MTAAPSAFRPSKAQIAQLARGYASHRPLIQRCLTAGFVAYVLGATYHGLAAKPSRRVDESSARSRSTGKGKTGAEWRPARVAVDDVFYKRLSVVLRIVIPGIRSKEAMLLVMHSSLLVFRTAISLYVAALDGKIVASLVRAEALPFLFNIVRWLLVAIPDLEYWHMRCG